MICKEESTERSFACDLITKQYLDKPEEFWKQAMWDDIDVNVEQIPCQVLSKVRDLLYFGVV